MKRALLIFIFIFSCFVSAEVKIDILTKPPVVQEDVIMHKGTSDEYLIKGP